MMKTFTNINFKRSLLVFSFSLLFAIVWSSCKKSDSTDTTTISYLSVVNGSPSTGTFNVYANDVIINKAALPMGGSVLPYVQLVSGSNTLRFTTASSTDNLLSKTISLSGSTAYTYFLIGQSGQLDGVLATDVMTTVSTDKAFVRFVNLSPDAPSLNLAVTGGSVVINNQFYKQVSSFVAVDPKTYSFDIQEQSTGKVKTTLTGATLVAGKYYTVMALGMVAPGAAENALNAQVMTNQ
jgi:hypothetical protein